MKLGGRFFGRFTTATLITAVAVVGSVGATPPYSGRSLEDVLRELQTGGLKIVYSTAVVRPGMIVENEPRASDPRKLLDEILEPHDLVSREAAGGIIVIVAAAAPGHESTNADSDSGPVAAEPTIPNPIFLAEVVVTPSRFTILEERPEARQFLSRNEVEQMPHLADDLYRAVRRLPGMAGGDYSASFNVRGGEQGELLVLLDGAELYEPFHLKDFQNVFSVIDSAAVGSVDLLTGGFPVEFGDRMSGVMDISVATPSGPTSTALVASTMNAGVVSQGLFDEGEGSWLVSARAWYPDFLPNLVDITSDWISTEYYDLFAKIEHSVGSRSTLSADLLMAFDDLGYRTEDVEGFEEVTAKYDSAHLWFNLRTTWTERLSSQTVLGSGRLTRHRVGGLADSERGDLSIDDRRSFDFADLRQDWTYDLNQNHLLKWGIDVTHQESFYDYLRSQTEAGPQPPPDPTETTVDLEPEGWAFGLYAAERFRPLPPLVIELGLRWDRQTWIDDNQLSPRVNVLYSLGPRTALRAAWGRFHQSQRLNELQVEDGVTEFFPAQRAEHWLAGLEHRYDNGTGLRFEVFQKNLSHLRPRYENLLNPIDLFPEALPDRTLVDPDRGRARGLEVVVKRDTGGRLSWWFSYVLAVAEDRIDADWQPRNWDQRHAATVGLNLALPRRWNLNFAGTWRTGWPTTEVTGEVVVGPGGGIEVNTILGPRNGARLPAYHRFDVRATKDFSVQRGDLALVIEILNLFNTKNFCCLDDVEFEVGDDGSVTAHPTYRRWMPIIPSVGVRYTF